MHRPFGVIVKRPCVQAMRAGHAHSMHNYFMDDIICGLLHTSSSV